MYVLAVQSERTRHAVNVVAGDVVDNFGRGKAVELMAKDVCDTLPLVGNLLSESDIEAASQLGDVKPTLNIQVTEGMRWVAEDIGALLLQLI